MTSFIHRITLYHGHSFIHLTQHNMQNVECRSHSINFPLYFITFYFSLYIFVLVYSWFLYFFCFNLTTTFPYSIQYDWFSSYLTTSTILHATNRSTYMTAKERYMANGNLNFWFWFSLHVERHLWWIFLTILYRIKWAYIIHTK